MSYWITCIECDRGLPYPTMEEQLLQSMEACPGCNTVNATEVPLGEALLGLLERIQVLEEKLRCTP